MSNTGNMINLHHNSHPNTKGILWQPLVTTFHKSMQSSHWNGCPGTHINTCLGIGISKYQKSRELLSH